MSTIILIERWAKIEENKSGCTNSFWSQKMHLHHALGGRMPLGIWKGDVTATIRTNFVGPNGAGTTASNNAFFGVRHSIRMSLKKVSKRKLDVYFN